MHVCFSVHFSYYGRCVVYLAVVLIYISQQLMILAHVDRLMSYLVITFDEATILPLKKKMSWFSFPFLQTSLKLRTSAYQRTQL